MPELPEVEVVRLGLQASALGRTVTTITVRESRLRWPVPAQLIGWLAGRRLQGLQRRGKYLLLDFGTGWLIVHLGMSGTIRYLAQPAPLQPHDHVDIVFGEGLLRYNDPRRFGAILWHPREEGAIESHVLLAGLGVEPFSAGFDGALLHRASRGRKVSVKQFLLAGTAVVGVGNIYCSESLFRAGIRPTIGAGRISAARYELLAQAIRQTLSEAIERGGSSLRDFVGSDGASGYFQLDALVYGRAHQPCRTCGAPIRMVRQQQRASFYCAVCQH